MDRLSVEIQTLILATVRSISLESIAGHNSGVERMAASESITMDRSGPPAITDWIETGLPSHSFSFPYNVAMVCTLWRDIVSQTTEDWIRVVFDVAMDPNPLVDAFLWSDNLDGIEVVVFNTSEFTNEIEEEVRKRENRRISVITHALRPHIYRCKSIVFDVIFESSLPPPHIFFHQNLPQLEVLALHCQVNDLPVLVNSVTPDETPSSLSTSLSNMKSLSMTGRCFLSLGLIADKPNWFSDLRFGVSTTLWISQFKFSESGHYTMENFVKYLAALKIFKFKFRDLSLDHDYYNRPNLPANERAIISGEISFQLVSRDFLSRFYSITRVFGDTLAFTQCEIPCFQHLQDAGTLRLDKIIDDHHSQSLCNILTAWNGGELIVRECPSFNDAVLSWLSSSMKFVPIPFDSSNLFPPASLSHDSVFHYFSPAPGEPVFKLPVDDITFFSISDCQNFTPGALYEFIRVRDDLWVDPENHWENNNLYSIYVGGKGPRLTQADNAWFSQYSGNSILDWKTNNDGLVEDFTTSSV